MEHLDYDFEDVACVAVFPRNVDELLVIFVFVRAAKDVLCLFQRFGKNFRDDQVLDQHRRQNSLFVVMNADAGELQIARDFGLTIRPWDDVVKQKCVDLPNRQLRV